MVPFVIKPGGDITFTDTYFDRLQILEGREFQYRVPNATVYFKNDGGEYVQNLNTREEWYFGNGSPPAPTPTPGECNVDVSSCWNSALQKSFHSYCIVVNSPSSFHLILITTGVEH